MSTDKPDFYDEAESIVELDLPDELDPEMEQIFNEICYQVRENSDTRKISEDALGVKSYGVELIQEISRRKRIGKISLAVYKYCLAAAKQILNMEVIYFENQFETLREEDSAPPLIL